MTREIKFRAWDVRDKRMIYYGSFEFLQLQFQLSVRQDETQQLIRPLEGFESDEPILEDEPLIAWHMMQYTGLKDKDGRDIYEGDLIRYEQVTQSNSRIVVGEVVYRKDLCCFQGLEKLQFENSYRILSADPYDFKNPNKVYFDPTVEVVGNVYESNSDAKP